VFTIASHHECWLQQTKIIQFSNLMVSLCVISVLLSIRLAHSCIFHLCCLLPHFPLPHFQSPSFTPSVAIRCQIILCSLVSTASQWVIGILAALTNSLRSLSVSHVQLFRNMWAPVLPISSQRPPPYILVVENGRIIEISWGARTAVHRRKFR